MFHILRVQYRVLVAVCLLAGFAGRAGAETVVRPSTSEPLSARITAPENIRIAPELQAQVAAMLEGSPTFRQQYERIANTTRLVVNVRTDMTFLHRSFRARSAMRRYDSGLLIVTMDIAPGGQQSEWIGHEFEHVLEQLDGLSLRDLAARGDHATWYSSDRMVETARAMRAGRTVREEMRMHRAD